MVVPLNGDKLIQGDGKTAVFSITNLEAGSLVGCAIRFILALIKGSNEQVHLVTLTRGSGVTVTSETSQLITGEFVIPGRATAALTLPHRGAIAQWDFEVDTATSEPFTAQGFLLILPATKHVENLAGSIAIASTVGGT